MEIVVVALAILALGALVITWSASRLDHLHTRLERMDAALDAELLRRSASTLELATSGLLDPATAMVLADAAHRARTVGAEDREEAESALTAALIVAFDDEDAVATLVDHADRSVPGAAEAAAALLGDVASASRRVQTARRLYNDTVTATRSRRRSRFVRTFHLAGRAAMPVPIEFDDRVPDAFAR